MERVLLVVLLETRVVIVLLEDLELLVELRLDLSSLMTWEESKALFEEEDALEEISEFTVEVLSVNSPHP